MSIYFHDTYALIKIVTGEESYERYDQYDLVTTKLNLMEVYYYRIRSGFKDAEKIFSIFESSCVDITNEIIYEAMKFKLEHNKMSISYVDAIGYTIAKKEGMKFLTGDEAFKNMKNVEFVK